MTTQADMEQISDRLRAMSRDGGSIEAAQVKLIGLEEIREAAGPRWPRMRERVRTGSLNILNQHTGPEDVIIPAGDGFLVMLADGPAGDSQRRCQQMRDALLAFYLGDEALKTVRAEVQNRALNADGLSQLIASSLQSEQRLVARSMDDEIMLAPVLVTHEQKLGAHLAAPVVRAEAARRICYNPDFILDGRHHDDRDYLELDLAVLDVALGRATRARDGGPVGAIGATVHATTMRTRRAREAYLGWLSQVEPEVRRHMFVMIAEIERGTPLISISEWCSGLRAYAAKVWLDFHYADLAIGSVGAAGAWAAGFSLPAYAAAQRGARAQRLSHQIGFWSKALRSQGLRVGVHGYQDAEFLEQAGALGVDMLTSDAHWPFSPSDVATIDAPPH